MTTRTVIAVMLCISCLYKVQANKILLFDTTAGAYLHAGSEMSLTTEGVATAAAALSGLVPSVSVQHDVSAQIEALLKPNVFEHPKAMVFVSLVGAGSGASADVEQAFQGKPHRSVQLSSSSEAASLLEVLGDLAAANPDVKPAHLDHTALQGCNEQCLQQHLQQAIQLLAGAHYMPQAGKALAGQVAFADSTTLALSSQAAKLWAMELAALYGSTQAISGSDSSSVQVYESTLVSLQALGQAFGKQSAEVQQARAALLAVLQHAAGQVDSAYGQQAVYQVALLGDAPVRSSDPSQLVMWKQVTRRSLLEAPETVLRANGNSADARVFSSKAAGYGAALILVYFSIAAVFCMCNMNIKQDTLLYTRAKVD